MTILANHSFYGSLFKKMKDRDFICFQSNRYIVKFGEGKVVPDRWGSEEDACPSRIVSLRKDRFCFPALTSIKQSKFFLLKHSFRFESLEFLILSSREN